MLVHSYLVGQPLPAGYPLCGRKQANKNKSKDFNLTLAAWNVRTLQDNTNSAERRTAIIARELKRCNIDIAALSETRLHGETQITEVGAGYTFFCKGLPEDQPAQQGVGFAIRSTLVSRITSVPFGINARIMSARVQLDGRQYVTIVSIYAPTLYADEPTKNAFYDELEHLVSSVPVNDKLFILGDFNSRVGKNVTAWQGVLGHHGVGNENANGTRLLTFCSQHELLVTNTVFQQANKNKTTWMHPRSQHWHLIDFVLVRQRDRRDVRLTRCMRGTACWSDHRLVRCTASVKFQKLHRLQSRKSVKFNLEKLQDSAVTEAFTSDIENRLGQVPSSSDPEEA